MEPRYHFNPETGETGICRPKSTGICGFAKAGEAEPPHYASEEDARRAFEVTNAQKTLPSGINKKVTFSSKGYDEFEKRMDKHKRIPDFTRPANRCATDNDAENVFALIDEEFSDTAMRVKREIGLEIAADVIAGRETDPLLKEKRENRLMKECFSPQLEKRMRTEIGKIQSLETNMDFHGKNVKVCIDREKMVEKITGLWIEKMDFGLILEEEPNSKNTFPDVGINSSHGDKMLFEVKSSNIKPKAQRGTRGEKTNEKSFRIKLGTFKDFKERLKARDLSFFTTMYVVTSVTDNKRDNSYTIEDVNIGHIWDFTVGKTSETKDETGYIKSLGGGNPSDFIENMVSKKDQKWLIPQLKRIGILPEDFKIGDGSRGRAIGE